ncbi:P-loop containing nucleoside triphosphate hydrolase protein [Lentinula lateritia]|nr:P-loop containing nucleoside triphosphate hydrolase protein [Lentinula lateritia]
MSFDDLGLNEHLLKAIKSLGYTTPTPIQQGCITPALSGKDIIGLAPTGSGKTAAFAIPILQKLWDAPQGLFACVLAPTHELAYQISAQFEALGAGIGVRCAVIIGGEVDRVTQAVTLAKKPHILIATPGRLADHLKATKGFSLRQLKFLVLDEADRLLDLDFGVHIDAVLKAIPRERTTYLFSATMTTKVSKLQRASLTDPVRVETSAANHTVDTLMQYYVFYPFKHKEVLLAYIVNSLVQNSMIIFVRNVSSAQRLNIVLRILGFAVVPIYGDLSQTQRTGALNKFKSGERKILVATDVASRGLDIPLVDMVINFDMPLNSKDYIHRVGRTARAGRAGKSITFTTQYDIELLQRLETVLGKKLEEWPTDKEAVMTMHETVDDAGRMAANELREESRRQGSKGASGKRKWGREDAAAHAGIEEIAMLKSNDHVRKKRRG